MNSIPDIFLLGLAVYYSTFALLYLLSKAWFWLVQSEMSRRCEECSQVASANRPLGQCPEDIWLQVAWRASEREPWEAYPPVKAALRNEQLPIVNRCPGEMLLYLRFSQRWCAPLVQFRIRIGSGMSDDRAQYEDSVTCQVRPSYLQELCVFMMFLPIGLFLYVIRAEDNLVPEHRVNISFYWTLSIDPAFALVLRLIISARGFKKSYTITRRIPCPTHKMEE
jgi:hypothetical protein